MTDNFKPPRHMNKLFACLIIFISHFSWTQLPNIDSLIQVSTSVKGQEKITLLSDISYYSTYINTNQAVEYGQKCLQESLIFGDSLLIAEGFNALAIALYAKSDFENSLASNLRALDIRSRHGDDYSLMSSYSKIGNCMHELGRFDEAIDYYLKSLAICEKNGLTAQMGQIANNIGELFKQQSKFDQSRTYYLQAIEIAEQTKDTFQLALSILNLGVNYSAENKNEAADSLYSISYQLIKNKNYLELEAGLMTNWGVVAQMRNDPESSINYYKRALEIYNLTGEVFGTGLVYSNLGKSYMRNNQPDSARYYLEKGLELAQETNALPRIINAYISLTDFYRQSGNFEKAFYYDSIADVLNDSIYNLENAAIIEDLNTQYQTAQKENQINQQKQALTKGELEKNRKNIQIYTLLGGTIALLSILFFLFRTQKIKRQNLVQEIELEKSKTQLRVQEEKLRISRDLHDNIGAQLTFIISSLDNLTYVQNENDRSTRISSVTNFTKETMNELRASIWTLKTEDLTIDSFNAKMSELFGRAKIACPSIQFKMETVVDEDLLGNELVVPLFRTLQEALNNAIKHSQAHQITYSYTNKTFTLSDNGIGFNLENSGTGNGLENMRSRMVQARIGYDLQSSKNEGTTLTLTLKNTTDNV